MNKITIKKIKYHEYKIADCEADIEFHEKRIKELTKEIKKRTVKE